jgi:H/ACA ribonucleoprotein complex non-core subunit NAF1
VHDEEPADDDLEFSDDEAEAAHRSRLKRKCGTFPILFFVFVA